MKLLNKMTQLKVLYMTRMGKGSTRNGEPLTNQIIDTTGVLLLIIQELQGSSSLPMNILTLRTTKKTEEINQVPTYTEKKKLKAIITTT